MAFEHPLLAPLRAALGALVEWFQSGPYPGVVIGGVAASVLGRPRVTRDVDAVVVIPEDSWSSFLAAGGPFGFVPRISDPLDFARQSRVLLLR